MKKCTNLFFYSVLLGLLFPTIMLAQSHNGRLTIDFNHNWLFEKDDWVGLNNASHIEWQDSHWEKVQLPHSWNTTDTFDPIQDYYRGFGWYRKHFTIAPEHKDRILYLQFGAIYTDAQIWINEEYFGRFTTGYTPIELNITNAVNWDKENLIAVRVNNVHNDEIPPGRWRMDYNCYGGIYRKVKLVSVSPVHLLNDELIITTPSVSSKNSKISFSIKAKNLLTKEQNAKIICSLWDGNTQLVNLAKEILVPAGQTMLFNELETDVKNTKLWSIENPYLYNARFQLLVDGKLVDELQTKIGFRSFRFDPEKGFFLNESHVKLKGLNRHQGYPGLANAVPKRLQVDDARILKDLGANFVRCSHYPQHPDFLAACDSLGILVYEELASWQHIGGDRFISIMDQMLADMLRRDRNHPSIILWGLMNEGRSFKMFTQLQKTAQKLDPTRPTCYAENHIDEAIELGTAFIPDVFGLNYRLDAYENLHEKYPHLKLINTECSNPDRSYFGDLESELKGTLKINKDLDFLESKDFIAGSTIWGFHDYGSEYKPVWPIQTSGVVDIYRRYKEAAYLVKARWSEKPFIHISGHWNWPGEEGQKKDVYIWHNCESIQFYLNGKKVKIAPIEKNHYQINYQPGELLAVGNKGKVKIEHKLVTARDAFKIHLTAQSQSIKADGYDAVPLFAQLLDEGNNPVPMNGKNIEFKVNGPGRIIGIGEAKSAETAKGSAAILVQSTGKMGQLEITASAPELESGSCTIIVQ
jgi:beta-galactosidase